MAHGGGGGWNTLHEQVCKFNCCILSAKIELFGHGAYHHELKPNVNLNIKLNTSKSQVNRYLENVLN